MEKYQQVLRLWRAYRAQTAGDMDKYLDSFRVLFAYHSGRIENGAVTYDGTREIFENGQAAGYAGDPRTLTEQRNQKLCHEFIMEKLGAGEPVSIALVLEIHRILTSGTYDERRCIENGERPGEFKRHGYVVGEHETGSAPEDVERELGELIAEVNGYGKGNTLRIGAYLHARFENIHPFADGNGRTGRTLLNYFLMLRGHPPLIVYDENKALYFEALRAYDEKETLDPLHEFLIFQTERTWENALRLERGGREVRKGTGQTVTP